MKRTGTSEKIIIRRDLTKRKLREIQDAKELPLIAKTGKPFRLELTGDILKLLPDVTQQNGALRPLRISPDFLESHKRLIQKTEAYFSSIIDTEEIPRDEAFRALDGKQTVFDDPALQRIFNNCLTGASYIYSQWDGYWERDSFETMRAFIEKYKIPKTEIHTSGHASPADLQKFAKALNPKKVVPIHSFEPERYKELFENVETHKDGERWEVQ